MDHKANVDRIEMSVITWTYGFTLKKTHKSAQMSSNQLACD